MCNGPYEEEEGYYCPVCGRQYYNDSEHECPEPDLIGLEYFHECKIEDCDHLHGYKQVSLTCMSGNHIECVAVFYGDKVEVEDDKTFKSVHIYLNNFLIGTFYAKVVLDGSKGAPDSSD